MAIWDNAGPIDAAVNEESFFADIKAPEPTPEQVAEAEAEKEKRESIFKIKPVDSSATMNMFWGKNGSSVSGTIPRASNDRLRTSGGILNVYRTFNPEETHRCSHVVIL